MTDISPNGIWVLARGEELFLQYEAFPWFKRGSVEAILNVEEPSPGHHHWPDLDVDLGIMLSVMARGFGWFQSAVSP